MDTTEMIGDSIQVENAHQSKESFSDKVALNGDATPFVPLQRGETNNQTYTTFTLKVPLDSEIWKSISACSPHHQRLAMFKKPNTAHPANVPTRLISELSLNRSLMTEVSPDGLIRIRHKDNIFIDISMDRSLRIACPSQKLLICVSGSALSVAVFHPNGRIFQENSRVDLVAFDGSHQNNLLRYAKMWQRGISFMAKDVPVVYLVDEAGLRSSVDHFIHIKRDYALNVFNNRSLPTSLLFDEAVNMMQKSIYTHEMNGSEMIDVNQVRIISNSDGTIGIERPNKSCSIRINPRKVAISVTTPCVHATASMGKSPHLFLRQGDRRIHFDGAVFCVRNMGYSAGFDEKNQVTIFNKKNMFGDC